MKQQSVGKHYVAPFWHIILSNYVFLHQWNWPTRYNWNIVEGSLCASTFNITFQRDINRVDGVMVSVIASGVLDCWLEPRSGQIKTMKLVLHHHSVESQWNTLSHKVVSSTLCITWRFYIS
jgi:hypothetical protein